jgi:hypothetical protein
VARKAEGGGGGNVGGGLDDGGVGGLLAPLHAGVRVVLRPAHVDAGGHPERLVHHRLVRELGVGACGVPSTRGAAGTPAAQCSTSAQHMRRDVATQHTRHKTSAPKQRSARRGVGCARNEGETTAAEAAHSLQPPELPEALHPRATLSQNEGLKSATRRYDIILPVHCSRGTCRTVCWRFLSSAPVAEPSLPT